MLSAAESDKLRVVLVGSRNPLNIGAAARALSNFGFPHLRVVRPYDVAFRQARSAVNAGPVMAAAGEFADVAAAVADCTLVVGTTAGERRKPEEPLDRLEAVAREMRASLRDGQRVAVLFGSEKVGLSNRDLSHCDRLLRIPTRAEHGSMNLGQAVGIVLYELAREEMTERADTVPEPRATAGDRERLVEVLARAVAISGPAKGAPRKAGAEDAAADGLIEERMRGLVRHLQLSHAEAAEWLGILRRIVWKLER